MVESLKELNQICQKPRYKEVGNWMVRHILRDAALPLTWLLLHTKVTANQVTLVSLIVGLLGIFFLSIPGLAAFILGCVLLQLWYYLDHVDGQIARYRKTASLTGRFYDFIVHHVIHGVLFFGLGFYVYARTSQVFFLILGFITSSFMIAFNLINDIRAKTFMEKIEKSGLHYQVATEASTEKPKTEASFPRKVFSFAHKLVEIHVLMNLLTLFALIQWWVLAWDYRFLLFLIYSLLVPAVTLMKYSYIISKNKIDQDFSKYSQETAQT